MMGRHEAPPVATYISTGYYTDWVRIFVTKEWWISARNKSQCVRLFETLQILKTPLEIVGVHHPTNS